ncbi:MAG: hypothetical protein M3N68_05700 [Actinomycetota bacterium]|nr:hypothetical protein [Actinomycetota bacterium]
MDGWTIVLVIGGAMIVLLMALVAVITITARRIAVKAEAVLVALEEVRTKTLGLSELDADQGPPAPTEASGDGRSLPGGLAGTPDPA